jgi:phosphoglycolate phosphatase
MMDGVPGLLVFDLDGTLIDSRIDLCNAVNAMLAQLGRPRLPEPVIASYIGDGASLLVRRALGDPEGDVHDEEFVADALARFLELYKQHMLDTTYVYPGVMESLAAIRERLPALPMAVLTNKPVVPARAICAHFGLERFFFQNYGGNSFHTKKPDPHGLLTLVAEASERVGRRILPVETVMIGDSDVDVLTAKGCGARSVGCAYGLAPHTLAAAGPDVVVQSAAEWVGLFAG